MMKKINVCIDFNRKPPLSKWHNDVFTDSFFKDERFEFVSFDDFSRQENNFVFLYCVPNETLTFLSSVGDDFFSTLREKNIKILFQNEQFNLFMYNKNIFKYEPTIKYNCYDINDILYWKILNILKKHNIKEDQLFFIHSSKGFLEEIKEMKTRKILWIDSTLDLKSKHLQYNNNFISHIPEDLFIARDFRYHFACLFAGRPARHRHYLLKSLWNRNLLDFGKCSLAPCPDMNDTSEFNQTASNLYPIGRFNSHLHSRSAETDIFKDIFIWIAGETFNPNGYPYFTEKTTKAIFYERPFISYGNPGTLAYLRDHGFKTFNDFWDESYDDEKDDDKKIEMITNIVKNICQKPLSELDDMYDKMKPILEFNKNLLIKTDWRKELVKFLSQEI